MARGSNKLFRELIKDENVSHTKGRSETLYKKRNCCLIERYIFYVICSEKRYEAIIDQLSDDFFLSPVTISNILSLNYGELSRIKKEYQEQDHKKLYKTLTSKWPAFNWGLDTFNRA